ncbi:type II secretion system protein GspJ [Simiduia sp. 21SJ11W-1]|uniref:type II secretion system protein GspJ n=1 Tax=Simiduia sp. 21SJ11W-1 TaxID=2909669 RepID=UPI00209DE7C2|nr:type II secretion system protein GspJ [Simiduia sp. 21SJ11W-1]UTA47880.1 type II secretion system protein GspJ [Simiduia sp. 21SJ11W-1]
MNRAGFSPVGQSPRQQGFTLVEVLIAIFIAAIIATLAVQSLSSATTAMERGKSLSDQLSELDRFFLVLEQDLRTVRAGRDFKFEAEPVSQSLAGATATGDDDFLGYGEAFETQDIKQQRHNLLADLDVDHRFLQLVRGNWVNFGVRPRSDLQHVTYAWHKGAIWRFFRPIDNEVFGDNPPADAVYYEDISMARRLVTQVDNLTVRFLAPGSAANNANAWADTWPPATGRNANNTGTALPLAVEVVIELQNVGEVRRVMLLGIEN